MQVSCRWDGGMKFLGTTATHEVPMDAHAPLGKDSGMTPKELVAAGLCGCTAMDVASLLKKQRQDLEELEVVANIKKTESGHPSVFTAIELIFRVRGEVDAKRLMEAVQLSQTKYCGVSAMLSKAVPITYRVELNGVEIGKGMARFDD